MLNSKRIYLIKLLFLAFYAQAQTNSSSDTLYYSGEKGFVETVNKFILEKSVMVIGDGSKINPRKIDYINGKIFFNDSTKNQNLVISYDYLLGGLPLKIKPRWLSLPPLDSLINSNSLYETVYKKDKIEHNSKISSSGSIFRGVSLNPIGGSEILGGLQMQINGKLSDNMNISGNITDQDFKIQPEGTTRQLEDIDNVSVNIEHSNFEVNAGDILYKNNNIDRKLIGIQNFFEYGANSGSAVYAISEGNFKVTEIKGIDGNQGPYQLTNNEGGKEIVIISGTEKVWVNGKKLIRGSNYDYTIDYSTAQVIFTPKILIKNDTDILFEYQYSDYEYRQSFIGGSVERDIGNVKLNFGLYQESDLYREDDLSTDILDSLSESYDGLLKYNTFYEDNQGDYILENNIFRYLDGEDTDDTIRYNVSFQSDVNGYYKREISSKGRVYYKYLNPENRGQFENLYSPYTNVNAPKSHNFGYLGYTYKINENLKLYGKNQGNVFDQNRLSDEMVKTGNSSIIGLSLDSIQIGDGKLYFDIENWTRSENYRSLARENDPLFTRLWNLDTIINKGIKQIKINTAYKIDDKFASSSAISRLQFGNRNLTRYELEHKTLSDKFNSSFFKYLIINNKYSRHEGKIKYNQFNISPFLTFLAEKKDGQSQFYDSGLGYINDNGQKKILTGINYREDYQLNDSNNRKMITKDIVGHVEYTSKSANSINTNLIYKKRLKSKNQIGQQYDYSLLDVDMGTFGSNDNFRWEINLRREEVLSQKMALVFDSLGIGLGNYRYDKTFNTYISDPNGAFISYNVYTGDMTQNTSIKGTQKLFLDLFKSSRRYSLSIRNISRQEFQGFSTPTINKLLKSNINDSTLVKSDLFNRLEIFYVNKNNLSLWYEISKDLNGYDPRGNDLKEEWEIGGKNNLSISEIRSLNTNFKIRSYDIDSKVSDSRKRSAQGWWIDSQFRHSFDDTYYIDLGILAGTDVGLQQLNKFHANATGIKVSSTILFRKSGRFNFDASLVKVTEQNDREYLPPETLNGYPLGISFKTNSRFQYFLGNNTSIILSMATIDDIRYDNFISINGEIRAYF